MIIAGIDYSYTSPAVCIHKGADWSYTNCIFYYLTQKDKHLVNTKILKGSIYPSWKQQEERFSNLSSWAAKHLTDENVSSAMLEGYAFGAGSKGLVFQIGENTGRLKSTLWEKSIPFQVTPPTVIKKFATGKGNANKEKMWESFKSETNINLFDLLGQEEGKHWNPVSDIVDSYFIAKYLHSVLTLPAA